ncbi:MULTISPECIES: MarR family winged helix-turn-helix transcriptional regulator [unclassified Ensifer]|uniref:MarR family winged helix-turn-helix transcriptional regulator n=1 Tax=unclassified Ensifer TaxID=2633371 RepID=UPI0008133CB8|nr:MULTISPECIES: MarR family winged helix-turn-helix transcriptional regulator [unclassified Ensifer]OCO99102.1 MarR family transcriptional regulator [Ensifer sp. LC11]OCO99303.1 MarR family transcriptional regulator [Ensifer sp. LC13]OCP12946.1 MarR family transcriptional regulator [Ensifer sp. LC14]OCP29658.1 MarR family transcriptional regulator [Ensifer sp. LC499]
MSRCYCALLRKATRRVTSLYDDALQPVGINLAQFSLLRHIERGEPISMTELGRKIELERSTVSRNVKVLEGMGLVTTASGKDQREAVVELTENGRRILAEGAPLWQGAQDQIEARLGTDAAAQLKELLQTL